LHPDGSPHVIRHNDHSMALRCRERAPSTASNGNPSRTGRHGWGPGNRALSSGKRDGGATMGTYNHTHSEKMTKKLCTELFGSVLQLYNPRPQSVARTESRPATVHSEAAGAVHSEASGLLMGGLPACAEVSRPQCGDRPGGKRPGSKAGDPLDPGPPHTSPPECCHESSPLRSCDSSQLCADRDGFRRPVGIDARGGAGCEARTDSFTVRRRPRPRRADAHRRRRAGANGRPGATWSQRLIRRTA
jgi:hypothetical protein